MKRFVALILAVATVFIFTACTTYDSDIGNYERDVEAYGAEEFMPKLDGLCDYLDADYLCRRHEDLFSQYTLQLIVKYGEDDFLERAGELELAYEYLDAPQTSEFDDGVLIMPVTAFSYAGFEFRVTKLSDTVYPKYFGMVGVCEQRCEIAYLWVCDPDLDYICEAKEDRTEAMISFVERSFRLK